MKPLSQRAIVFALAPFIIGLTALASTFFALKNNFVLFDDDDYITNQMVPQGLTWAGIRWAFTTGHAANYHPITWLSHMADVSLFGMHPAGHHLTSVIFHMMNSVLLFWVLWKMSGGLKRSAAAAILFAVHPLHVESVAWVSERKDLLCAFFLLISLLLYTRYAVKRDLLPYLGLHATFALALLSKPMAVTFPFLLLLLDYWPLGRTADPRQGDTLPLRARALLREKIPLIAMAAAAAATTYGIQRLGGAMKPFDTLPVHVRIENAAISYVRYLWKMFWPLHLSPIYPHPGTSIPLSTAVLAVLFLLALTIAVWRLRKRAPYLLVGWLWFVGMLIPVIGLVQVGYAAMADRYMYLPMVGILIGVVWGIEACIGEYAAHRRLVRLLILVVFLGIEGTFCFLTQQQCQVWRDSESLFRHAIAVTTNNAEAYTHLGVVYLKENRPQDAVATLSAAVTLRPSMPEAWTSLGVAYRMTGDLKHSADSHEQALTLAPDDPNIRVNCAVTYIQSGELTKAEAQLREAIRLSPGKENAQRLLGTLLQKTGRAVEAAEHLAVADSVHRADFENGGAP